MHKAVEPPPAQRQSLLDQIAAPAPRYLMRIALLDKLIDRLPASLGRFLEIGPGMGDVSNYLLRRFDGVRGNIVDISEESIDIVRRRLEGCDRATLSVADFINLRDLKKYDLVVACEVFEHIDDDAAAFAAVNRLLATGGHFLFSVPAFMKKWGPADQYGGHVRRYEKEALVRQFQEHGFDLVHFWSYGFPVTNIIGPVSSLYYRRAQMKSPLQQKNATKRSGTERSVATTLRRIPFGSLMRPFFFCQFLMKERNVGDGYVVLARKARDSRLG
ncbi:MAG: SAM-binding motif-containing protein [Gammaproteobacteria bacterium]|nr:MAG: SAM-binding motif-containing protein [Gammaproteobacteria bacterium]TND03659.1 MAG: SAM-binding motif-containing protein [Gammaproteobacteria bacterium]